VADVQGQVETQPALQPMNPHEAVQHISAMIQQEENPAPVRDEKGKFAKPEAPTEEAQPETEAPEVKAEEPQPEEDQPEAQPEPRKLKLKYKGEDKEVDEAEAVELAQKGYDYTQKSQALAKEREELAAKVKAETEQAVKQYETQLEVHKQAVLKLADPEALSADLNKLSLEDPARAQQLFFKRLQIHQTLQDIHAEQQRIAQARETEAQASKAKKISEARETIQREIPQWNQEVYGKILKTAVDSGATPQEANAITDPWQIKVLNEARQWRELQAAKPKTVDKRVAAVPKVQKPGTAEKTSPNADKLKESVARLTKTGDRNAAVDVVRHMIESGHL
jgi:hypothetical protein